LCQLPAQCFGLHEVRELLLAVDLDDWDQLPITSFELGIAVDRDLLELETQLVPKSDHGRPRPLAEVAVGRVVQAD
jgi:hypothetical protein